MDLRMPDARAPDSGGNAPGPVAMDASSDRQR